MARPTFDATAAWSCFVTGMWCAFLGFWAGAFVTIPAVVLSVMSGGLGHGDYLFARLLYPYAMMSWRTGGGGIAAPHIGLALAQFPAYGVVFGLVYPFKPVRRPLGPAMILAHLSAVILCGLWDK